MITDEKSVSGFLAISELTKEIEILVQDSMYQDSENLTAFDIEYVLKIISDVIERIKSQIPEIASKLFS